MAVSAGALSAADGLMLPAAICVEGPLSLAGAVPSDDDSAWDRLIRGLLMLPPLRVSLIGSPVD